MWIWLCAVIIVFIVLPVVFFLGVGFGKSIEDTVWVTMGSSGEALQYRGKFYHVLSQYRFNVLEGMERLLRQTTQDIVSLPGLDVPEEKPAWLLNDFAHIVYKLLCHDEEYPEDTSEHWEGWMANRLGRIHDDMLLSSLCGILKDDIKAALPKVAGNDVIAFKVVDPYFIPVPKGVKIGDTLLTVIPEELLPIGWTKLDMDSTRIKNLILGTRGLQSVTFQIDDSVHVTAYVYPVFDLVANAS